MPFEEQLIDQLELLFDCSTPPPVDSNPCGSCTLCCTASGLTRQNVTQLEIALLRRHYGREKSEEFARYAAREKNPDGNHLYEVCPNLGETGCQVYPHRPFSCRVFGFYRERDTRLPEVCVYRGADKEFVSSEYYRVVPGALRLRQLSRDYQMLGAQPCPLQFQGSAAGVGLNLQDPFDQALQWVTEGRAQEALSVLPTVEEAEPVFASYVRALVAGELQLHGEALAHYQKVLLHCPGRSDLMTFAGFHAFQLADPTAESLWLQSLALNPSNPLTHSFLGYFYLQQQQWQRAADFFGAAAELQPEQASHAARRQQALFLGGAAPS